MEDKVFTLFWLDNDTPELVFGTNIVDAFEKGGYDGTDVNGLDFYEEGDKVADYIYNHAEKKWKHIATTE